MLATECNGHVLVVTLSRPPVNALDGALLTRFEAALDAAVADPEITLLHVRSDCKAFCAGADLALMRSCLDTPEGREAMIDLVRRLQRLFARFEQAAVVTLAEIGGAAMGGGLELALACDLRVAALDAKLGLPEARLGLLPAAGGTQRLTRLCGEGTSKRLILGAEVIDGAEALRLGLVQWAAPREELPRFCEELAARVAALPRAALGAAKRCIALGHDSPGDGFAAEMSATRALSDEPETQRRVAQFLGKTRHEISAKELP
ncbi:MAG TPA: enoyl-CoA hydratase/isomerase family protein [Actinomycetota bacterium]|nr:enoyl-CoA hydratase/isomerase family protein [Actinomycetota bacterium]